VASNNHPETFVTPAASQSTSVYHSLYFSLSYSFDACVHGMIALSSFFWAICDQ